MTNRHKVEKLRLKVSCRNNPWIRESVIIRKIINFYGFKEFTKCKLKKYE